MRTNRTTDEWADWCIAKNQIAEVLKEYYRACTTEELPPQLLTLLKKLDDELLKRQEQ
jgi:Anti-sigma factor NepR